MQSDHLAVLGAYSAFDGMRGEARFSFARDRFLGIKTLQAIGSLKRQLLEALSTAGVAPAGLRASRIEDGGRRAGGCDGVRLALGQPDNDGAPRELLCCILLAALHPRLGYIVGGGGNAGADQLRLHLRDAAGEAMEPQVEIDCLIVT